MGGVPKGAFSTIAGELGSLAKKSVIAREFLLEVDASLAIATLGLRPNLLLQEPRFEKKKKTHTRQKYEQTSGGKI